MAENHASKSRRCGTPDIGVPRKALGGFDGTCRAKRIAARPRVAALVFESGKIVVCIIVLRLGRTLPTRASLRYALKPRA